MKRKRPKEIVKKLVPFGWGRYNEGSIDVRLKNNFGKGEQV